METLDDNKISTEMPFGCAEHLFYALAVFASLFLSWFLGAMASDHCHGTSVGGYLSQRICYEPEWGYVPLLIDIILLATIIGIMIGFRVAWYIRLLLFTLYVGFTVVGTFYILRLPFFTERVCGVPGKPECFF